MGFWPGVTKAPGCPRLPAPPWDAQGRVQKTRRLLMQIPAVCIASLWAHLPGAQHLPKCLLSPWAGWWV